MCSDCKYKCNEKIQEIKRRYGECIKSHNGSYYMLLMDITSKLKKNSLEEISKEDEIKIQA